MQAFAKFTIKSKLLHHVLPLRLQQMHGLNWRVLHWPHKLAHGSVTRFKSCMVRYVPAGYYLYKQWPLPSGCSWARRQIKIQTVAREYSDIIRCKVQHPPPIGLVIYGLVPVPIQWPRPHAQNPEPICIRDTRRDTTRYGTVRYLTIRPTRRLRADACRDATRSWDKLGFYPCVPLASSPGAILIREI